MLLHLYRHVYFSTMQASFDRETTPSFRITVTCSDHGRPEMTSRRDIDVEIDDVNDNAPTFGKSRYVFRVTENTEVNGGGGGREIGAIEASDPDRGDNGTVVFRLEPLHNDQSSTDQVRMISTLNIYVLLSIRDGL